MELARFRRWLAALAVGVGIGLLAGRLLGGADARGTVPVARTEDPMARSELAALREDLEAEADVRMVPVAEVERLQEQLALPVARLEGPGDALAELASSGQRAAGEAPLAGGGRDRATRA